MVFYYLQSCWWRPLKIEAATLIEIESAFTYLAYETRPESTKQVNPTQNNIDEILYPNNEPTSNDN